MRAEGLEGFSYLNSERFYCERAGKRAHSFFGMEHDADICSWGAGIAIAKRLSIEDNQDFLLICSWISVGASEVSNRPNGDSGTSILLNFFQHVILSGLSGCEF